MWIRWCTLCMAIISPMVSFCDAAGQWTPQEQLQQTNGELKQLYDLKGRYKAAAARHEDEGNRWQFMQNQKQEAKRAYQRADMEREMVREIQVRIDYLEGQKADLLKQHPGMNAK
jgi:hypothetical protein